MLRWTALRIGLAAALLPGAGCALVHRSGGDTRAIVASRSLSQRGLTAIEQQDWKTAEVLLSEAVEVCGACPEARRYYAETLWHKGDTVQALKQLDMAIDASSQDASLWVRRAEMKLDLNQIAEARADADRAIDVDPSFASGWIVRARAQERAGKLKEALGDLHRALACDSSRNEILVEIAEIYRQLGDPQRALMNLQSVAENYSRGTEPPRVLFLSGLAYSALGRYDDAAAAYHQAAERGGADAELSYRMAEALWLAKQPQSARAALAEALAINPQHVASRQLLEQIELASLPRPAPR